MNTKTKKIVALILAAGESKRLGKPKQNLILKNRTMLNHIKEHLTLNIVERTFIVLGAYADEIVEKSNLHASEYFVFDGWKQGMGSSLAYACSRIFAKNEYDGILITLSDLPLVETADYQAMIDLFENENDIVATKANNIVGVPAVFGAKYFDDLMALNGHTGAKVILKQNKVKLWYNENAAADVDTPGNYKQVSELFKKR